MSQRSGAFLIALGGSLGAAAYLAFAWEGALVVGAGLGVGGLAGLLASRRHRRRPARAAAVARAPAPRVPARTEFVALRAGPGSAGGARERELGLTGAILRSMEAGGRTTRGRCSRCASILWLSARRPVRARCPVCGLTRVLT